MADVSTASPWDAQPAAAAMAQHDQDPELSEAQIAADFEQDAIQEIPAGEVSLPHPTEPAAERISRLHGKARGLPQSPGVYLMKDTRSVVIYVGKSLNLRDRVSSYFIPSTDLGPAKQRLLDYVCDFDTLACESEVEALLVESRLIKDIKPRFNARLSDGKSYPYLEITSRDEYPGVYVTRNPRPGSRLYGPFMSGYALKQAVIYLQRAFKFRTCHLEILEEDTRRRYFRPCLLYAIKQCTAPCADRISREAYKEDIERLKKFLDSSRNDTLKQMTAEMEAAAAALNFEQAAALRDQIKALQSLSIRGANTKLLQPEVFFQDLQGGLRQLQNIFASPDPVRSIECIDIAHFQGEATVGSLVAFIDGKPFKNGYRRFRIKGVTGIDDYRCIQEVVTRRYRAAGAGQELYPDLILIDGGLGQLHAAEAAFENVPIKPPLLASLAKREEIIYVRGRAEPFRLPKTSQALKILQHIRDEAHRFAQHYHHVLIARRQFEQLVGSGKRPPAKNRRNPAQPTARRKAIKPHQQTVAPNAPLTPASSPANTTALPVLTTDDLRQKISELKANRTGPLQPPH